MVGCSADDDRARRHRSTAARSSPWSPCRLGVFLVANDFTALSVALPDIERDFDPDLGAVQWVINGYALVFGVLIVTGGRLCDLYGRRKLFFWGAGIFAVFSAVAAMAPSLPVLLAARADGRRRGDHVAGRPGDDVRRPPARKAGLAGGLVLGVAGLGNAVGPLVGGVLTETLGWRWVFVVNLPVAAIAVLATWRYIHQPLQRDARRARRRGVVALTVASSPSSSPSTRSPSSAGAMPGLVSRCSPGSPWPSSPSSWSSGGPVATPSSPAR